jgi:hypothetical protein
VRYRPAESDAGKTDRWFGWIDSMDGWIVWTDREIFWMDRWFGWIDTDGFIRCFAAGGLGAAQSAVRPAEIEPWTSELSEFITRPLVSEDPSHSRRGLHPLRACLEPVVRFAGKSTAL